MENVRLQDIAESLHLSIATVSNVLNGKDHKVSAATRARVMEAIEKAGYLPERAEVLLGRNPSRIIGLVLNDHSLYEGSPLEDPYIASFISALQKSARAHQLDLLVRPVKTWKEAEEFASIWNMQGLVMTGFCEADYVSLRQALHIPLAVCDSLNPPEGFSSIQSEDRKGGELIGKHLRNLGHSRTLCITIDVESSDLERIKGLKEAGLEVEIGLVSEERKQRMEQLKAMDYSQFSSVVCLSDRFAIEVLSVLYEKGIRVPQDLSVVGYDGIPAGEYSAPPLTTLAQAIEQKAELAICSLEQKPASYISEVSLIIRNSTGVAHE